MGLGYLVGRVPPLLGGEGYLMAYMGRASAPARVLTLPEGGGLVRDGYVHGYPQEQTLLGGEAPLDAY